jgi:hypothetical protein
MPLVAVLSPLDVDVDRLLTLLLVELRPVERLEMPLVAVLRPLDVEVDRLLTLLFVELRPVDRLEMPLVASAVLRPVDKLPMLLGRSAQARLDVEVDRLLTLLFVELLSRWTGSRCRWWRCSDPTWTSCRCCSSQCSGRDDVEVDRLLTLLLVELSPVDSRCHWLRAQARGQAADAAGRSAQAGRRRG